MVVFGVLLDSVVGIIMLPLEGNPHKSMALIAHPGEIAATSASHDGRFMFTVGGADGALNMWRVNTESLVATANIGGKLPVHTSCEITTIENEEERKCLDNTTMKQMK